jgi:hypothetical protein
MKIPGTTISFITLGANDINASLSDKHNGYSIPADQRIKQTLPMEKSVQDRAGIESIELKTMALPSQEPNGGSSAKLVFNPSNPKYKMTPFSYGLSWELVKKMEGKGIITVGQLLSKFMNKPEELGPFTESESRELVLFIIMVETYFPL